jgi:hypothetical protein
VLDPVAPPHPQTRARGIGSIGHLEHVEQAQRAARDVEVVLGHRRLGCLEQRFDTLQQLGPHAASAKALEHGGGGECVGERGRLVELLGELQLRVCVSFGLGEVAEHVVR